MSEMEKTGMIEQGVTPPEDETKCASEDQLEEHVCKRLADQAFIDKTAKACCGQHKCGGITRSDFDEALKAFRDGGCCGN